jgi:hypothetical protein
MKRLKLSPMEQAIYAVFGNVWTSSPMFNLPQQQRFEPWLQPKDRR